MNLVAFRKSRRGDKTKINLRQKNHGLVVAFGWEG